MKLPTKLTLAAMAASGLAFAASGASAAVVCNATECWHVKGHYDYKPEFNVTVHPDNWKWGANEPYKWHEHRGRGYWRDGVWIKF